MFKVPQIFQVTKLRFTSKKLLLDDNLNNKKILIIELINLIRYYSSCDCKKYTKNPTLNDESKRRGPLPWEQCLDESIEFKKCTPFENTSLIQGGIPPCKPFEGQGSYTRRLKSECEWRRIERCKRMSLDEAKCYYGLAPDCSIIQKVYPMRHAVQKKWFSGQPKPGWQKLLK